MAAVSTPCTRQCALDSATALCRGCGRTLAEIAAWASLTEPERIAIMTALPARRLAPPAESRPVAPLAPGRNA